jgi:hypothetical protein
MCFSAPASFIASGGLTALGAASLVVAKKENKILAAIPFLFGIQQGFEGIQWLYLNSGSSSLFAGYGFLFFALMVWPIYVPTLVYILDKKNRGLLRWFVALGIIVAAYVLELFLTQSIHVSKLGNCIGYSFDLPMGTLSVAGYMLAVFGSFFISKKPFFRWFGAINFVLAFIAWLFFTKTFTSVWCFFAAISSSIIFLFIFSKKHSKYLSALRKLD